MIIDPSDIIPIRVVHVKKVLHYFPIHRPFPLGNPFPMREERDRGRVCRDFESYFRAAIARGDESILNELSRATRMAMEQGYLDLGCYCIPRKCHGLSVKIFLDSVLNPGATPEQLGMKVCTTEKSPNRKPRLKRARVTAVRSNKPKRAKWKKKVAKRCKWDDLNE